MLLLRSVVGEKLKKDQNFTRRDVYGNKISLRHRSFVEQTKPVLAVCLLGAIRMLFRMLLIAVTFITCRRPRSVRRACLSYTRHAKGRFAPPPPPPHPPPDTRIAPPRPAPLSLPPLASLLPLLSMASSPPPVPILRFYVFVFVLLMSPVWFLFRLWERCSFCFVLFLTPRAPTPDPIIYPALHSSPVELLVHLVPRTGI